MKEFNPYLREILDEMCSRVDTTVEEVDWDDKQWYLTREWSETDQKSFEGWLADYWYNNNKSRKYMTTIYYRNKSRLKKAASEFTFMYGWKLSK
jgi:hypothetical protein